MTDFEALLGTLDRNKVEYIIAGGAAAIAHGSSRLTQHLDVVCRRTPENLSHLVMALKDFSPYLRGVPLGLPFTWDAETLRRGLNFTLITSLGAIDLLGDIPGGGTYDDLIGSSISLPVFQGTSRWLSLDQLIRAKRAAGRPKDLEALAELQAIREEFPEV